MSIKLQIKKMVERVPPQVGYYLKGLPYDLRLGKKYSYFVEKHQAFETAGAEARKDSILAHIRKRVQHAYTHIPFYKSLLDSQHLRPADLKTFEDIQQLPLVTKTLLKSAELPQRTWNNNALGLFNTGGTSGNPLGFYLDNDHYSREWAFMHQMWGRIGYTPSDMKLTVRGKSVGDGLYKYNLSQNEFILNSYFSYTKEHFESLAALIRRYGIRFIHGYPSSIYMFLKQAEAHPFFTELLRERVHGIVFSSEFPIPAFRNYIESVVTDNTISFYGHTEGCVMAGELYKKNEYVPYHAYGYVEAVPIGATHHLVSTNYYNYCSPFIRYDTEDLISPTFKDGMLESFEIREGRTGDFIEDRHGAQISLTSFFFGRHHKIYTYIDHFQVEQTGKGRIIIYLISKKPLENPGRYFDFSNFEFDVEFRMVDTPFRTPIGKVPFLIRKQAS